MSMEHKAFIFDTCLFSAELLPIMEVCIPKNDVASLKDFVRAHLANAHSPYSGEALQAEWELELCAGDILEAVDFAMTCYYFPEEDRGLGEAWDALLETLRKMKPRGLDAERAVLGKPLKVGGLEIDPGRMGTGFVQAEDISGVHDSLRRLRVKMQSAKLPLAKDLLYELSGEELMEAYDNLTELYKDATEENKGLLFTF